MRIISKFKDYYDGVQVLNQDHSVIFHRITSDPEELAYPVDSFYRAKQKIFPPLKYQFLISQDQINYKSSNRKDLYRNAEYRLISLVFCGKVYRCIEFEFKVINKNSLFGDLHLHYCWDMDLLQKACEDYGSELPDINIEYSRKTRPIEEYFKDNGTKVSIDLFNKEDAIISVQRSCRTRVEADLIRNPCLKDLQFFKIIDPFTAYQEIDMFLSGVLAPENKPMVKIEDKYRVQQHGFDPKFGFRTRPK